MLTLAFDKSKLGTSGSRRPRFRRDEDATAEPYVRAFAPQRTPASWRDAVNTPVFGRSTQLAEAETGDPLPEKADETRFDPLFDLYRWTPRAVIYRALALHRARTADRGARPDILLQQAGHDELVGPMLADHSPRWGFPGSVLLRRGGAPGTLQMWRTYTINGQHIRGLGPLRRRVAPLMRRYSWRLVVGTVVSPYRRGPTKSDHVPHPRVQKQATDLLRFAFQRWRARIAAMTLRDERPRRKSR